MRDVKREPRRGAPGPASSPSTTRASTCASRATPAAGIPVLYYIAPQVWAWHRSRMRSWRGHGPARRDPAVRGGAVPGRWRSAVFVGIRWPTVGARGRPRLVPAATGVRPGPPGARAVPGSRAQEVRRQLERSSPPRGGAAALCRRCSRSSPQRRRAGSAYADVPVSLDGRRLVAAAPRAGCTGEVRHEHAAGRAGGHAAGRDVPRASAHFFMARDWSNVPHVGLVNLVAGERIAPELLQDEATAGAAGGSAAAVARWIECRAGAATRRAAARARSAAVEGGRPQHRRTRGGPRRRAAARMKDGWRYAAAGRAGGLLLDALLGTTRMERINPEAFRVHRAAGRPIVFALWHGQLLPPPGCTGMRTS
jgi:hypothetical protein